MRLKPRATLFALCVFALGAMAPTSQATTGDVKIDANNFPDAQLRKELCSKDIDKNKDGILSKKEIDSCTSLRLHGTKETPIKSLQGLDKFNLEKITYFNIKYVTCDYMEVVNKMSRLQDLCIIEPQDEVIDISELHIKDFYCHDDGKKLSKWYCQVA